MFFVLVFLIVVAGAIGLTLRVVQDTERAVVFRLGRSRGALGPGLIVAVRGVDQVKRVTTKVIVLDVPVGEIVTVDDVSAEVKASVYLRVTDPEKAVREVENYRVASAHVAHDVIRAQLGAASSDQLLHQQFAVNSALTSLINQRTQVWGVSVEQAEISEVELLEEPDAPPQPQPSIGGLRVDEPAEFGDF